MTYPRPLCSNPTIIFNRNAIRNLLTVDEYFINGVRHRTSPAGQSIYRQKFPFRKFTKIGHTFERTIRGKKVIDWDALENSYCGYDRYGHKQYLFLAVPCGHCVLCTEKKQNDFVARVGFENQTSISRPMMITLTYDPAHLPFVRHDRAPYILRHGALKDLSDPDNYSHKFVEVFARNVPYVKVGNQYVVQHPSYKGFQPTVKKDDVQKFLKRLRINWTRSGISNGKPPLRYCCFSEYGTKYGRPHYHMILWNVPYNINSELDFTNIEKLKNDILKAWGMCSPAGLQCEVARDAAKYVGKYISKNLTKDHRHLFRLASNRGGGIGALFLEQQKDFLRQHPSVQHISYVDKWNGEYTESTFGSYALNRVFPSASSQIPDDYKQITRKLFYLTSKLSRVALAFKEYDVAKECKALSEKVNIYPSVIPSEYTPTIHLDKIDSSVLMAPMFTDYIQFYDDVVTDINKNIELLESMMLPDERDVLAIDAKRRYHNTLFDRPDVTDQQIESLERSILSDRKHREALETF